MSTVQIKGDQIKNSTVEASKLDLSDDYTFTGDVQVPSTPANNSSAVPKSYVLDLVQGLSYKEPVRVSDQSAISATYNNLNKTLTLLSKLVLNKTLSKFMSPHIFYVQHLILRSNISSYDINLTIILNKHTELERTTEDDLFWSDDTC